MYGMYVGFTVKYPLSNIMSVDSQSPDVFKIPGVDHLGNPANNDDVSGSLVYHWLDNKYLQFAVETRRLMASAGQPQTTRSRLLNAGATGSITGGALTGLNGGLRRGYASFPELTNLASGMRFSACFSAMVDCGISLFVRAAKLLLMQLAIFINL